MYNNNTTGNREPELITREKRWDCCGNCSGTWIRQICNVGVGDLPWITASNKMFLNKIRIEMDAVALRCLELWYADRVRSELSGTAYSGKNPFNLEFYESQDYVKNHIWVDSLITALQYLAHKLKIRSLIESLFKLSGLNGHMGPHLPLWKTLNVSVVAIEVDAGLLNENVEFLLARLHCQSL